MTKDQQIDKMARTICSVCRAHFSCRKEDVCVMAFVAAEGLYNDGYQEQITAKWIPNDVYYSPMNCYVVNGYTCSHCKTKVDEYTNFCSHCGAEMEIEGK